MSFTKIKELISFIKNIHAVFCCEFYIPPLQAGCNKKEIGKNTISN